MAMKPFEIFTEEYIRETLEQNGNEKLINVESFTYLLNDFLNNFGKQAFNCQSGTIDPNRWYELYADGDTHEALVIGIREIEKEAQKCDHKFPYVPDDKGALHGENLKNLIEGLITEAIGVCVRCNEKIGK